MIAYISGKLSETWGKSCIVTTASGVGYEISVPAHTFAQLPPPGENVAFFTYLAVREDALELFGFSTFEERQTFEILTRISKIGSRTALAILSSFKPEELRQAVMSENVAALLKVPGIGPKTAQHLILELKYRLSSSAVGRQVAPEPQKNSTFMDAMAALRNLGYDESECAPRLRDILQQEPDLDVGSAIRLALKSLAKGKS